MLFGGTGKGSVLDWSLRDGARQPVGDATYLCVVTVKTLSGGDSRRAGTLRRSPRSPSSAPRATVAGHDGRVGQVVSTPGALSFRPGDFFEGQDREAMRLTEQGLTVTGTLRAQGGIVFDGPRPKPPR